MKFFLAVLAITWFLLANSFADVPPVVQTDCGALAPQLWNVVLSTAPFEKSASQTTEGHGCIVWTPGPKKRE